MYSTAGVDLDILKCGGPAVHVCELLHVGGLGHASLVYFDLKVCLLLTYM